jgi:hypothetical protein
VEEALAAGDTGLADLTIRVDEAICALLGIQTSFVRSSRMEVPNTQREERLVDLCRAAGGNVYLSGPAARAYIDPRAFAAAGIELRYIVYDYPPYSRGPWPYLPNLSILDALAWLGPRDTARYLAAHGRSEREAMPC